ncbi:MAG: lamin tail domain-containing protein [Chloroflexota bacterium]|nr:lamin tail domain-containing protein [Chloroflexota bacterium]
MKRQWLGLIVVNAVISLLITLGVLWFAVNLGWIDSGTEPTPFVIVPSTATPGPTATATVPLTPTPTIAKGIYVVQLGDSLLAIAERLDVDPKILLKLNDIGDANHLVTGQELLVPLASLPTGTPTPTPTTAPSATPTLVDIPQPGPEVTLPVTTTASADIEAEAAITATLPVTGVHVVLLGVASPGDVQAEAVIIENQGGEAVQLRNWTLAHSNGPRYVFPPYMLVPGEAIWVHTRAGIDDIGDLHWARNTAVWSRGSAAILANMSGETMSELTINSEN